METCWETGKMKPAARGEMARQPVIAYDEITKVLFDIPDINAIAKYLKGPPGPALESADGSVFRVPASFTPAGGIGGPSRGKAPVAGLRR